MGRRFFCVALASDAYIRRQGEDTTRKYHSATQYIPAWRADEKEIQLAVDPGPVCRWNMFDLLSCRWSGCLVFPLHVSICVEFNLLVGGRFCSRFRIAGTGCTLVQLSDFQGKPVLLTFGATWRPDCRAEAPLLEAVRFWTLPEFP